MAWIDYKKAYDMVLHSWILKCLEMVGEAKNMISIISNSMVHWKTVLTSGVADLGQVNIKSGIFQGDSFLPPLFIVITLPLTLVFFILFYLPLLNCNIILQVTRINKGDREYYER